MDSLTEEKKEIFKSYYQRNHEYYINRLEKYLNNEKYTFSAKGFFLGLFWMSYRKMYKVVIVLTFLIFIESFLEEILYTFNLLPEFLYQLIGNLSLIIWASIYGFIGNNLYISKSIKDIEKISFNCSDIEQLKEKAKQKGGVNWFAPFILLLIIIAIVLAVV